MSLEVSEELALENLFWDRVSRYLNSGTKRYAELLLELRKRKPLVILEIGVYSGQRAKEMIESAALHHPRKDIWYLGFDLFDNFEEEILHSEFSKVPKSEAEIYELLKPTGANIHLFKGYSQDTLREFLKYKYRYPSIDYVFIDGGHAVATIASDWSYVKQIMNRETVVIFDDFYHGTHGENDKFGADLIIAGLEPEFKHDCLQVQDKFKKPFGELTISLVRVDSAYSFD